MKKALHLFYFRTEIDYNYFQNYTVKTNLFTALIQKFLVIKDLCLQNIGELLRDLAFKIVYITIPYQLHLCRDGGPMACAWYKW